MSGKKGITMMTLVTTIVIMALLLGVIVANVGEIDEEAVARKFLTEISMVEAKVLVEQYNAGATDFYVFKGTELTLQSAVNIDGNVYPDSTGKWYKLEESDLQNLGLRDIVGPYVVNYTTGKVLSIPGVEIYGKMYHTYEEAKKAIDS